MEGRAMPQSEPRIIHSNGRLRTQLEKLEGLVSRLDGFRNRLLGATPSTAPEQPKVAGDGMMDVQDGLVSDITEKIAQFDEIMSQLEGVC